MGRGLSPLPRTRIGIISPIVIRLPRGHGRWEETAGVDELRLVAATADRLGYSHLTCSEHVAVPVAAAAERGGTYWDPLATLSWLAAHTTRIRLATHVLVLGYHHPLALVKQYGTLDRLSGGRVVLGVGVGSLEEEFDLLGADFAGRGRAADEAIAVIREAWGAGEVDGFVVDPTSARNAVTIWVGGRTRRSLRRAVRLGDGWVPFGVDEATVARWLADAGAPTDFDVVLAAYGLDPLGEPDRTLDHLGRLVDAGATGVGVRLLGRSVGHWVEQAEALAALAGDG